MPNTRAAESEAVIDALTRVADKLTDIDHRTQRLESNFLKLEQFPHHIDQLISVNSATNAILTEMSTSIRVTLREQTDALAGKGQVPMQTHFITVVMISLVAAAVCLMGILAVSHFTRINIEGSMMGIQGRIEHAIEKQSEETRKEVRETQQKLEDSTLAIPAKK